MGFELNPSVKSIYHSGQKTYHLTQISRDHVVDSSGLDGSIGAYGRHGGGCDDSDQVGDADDEQSYDETGLTDDPGQPEVQHDAPNVEHTFHQNALHPAKFDDLKQKNNYNNSKTNITKVSLV